MSSRRPTPITGPTRVWVTGHPKRQLASLVDSAVLDADLGTLHGNREIKQLLRAAGATGPVVHPTGSGQYPWALGTQLRQDILQPVPAGPCNLWIEPVPGQGLLVTLKPLYRSEHTAVLVADATPADPLGPAPDHPNDWDPADRDQWLTWAGIRLDELRDQAGKSWAQGRGTAVSSTSRCRQQQSQGESGEPGGADLVPVARSTTGGPVRAARAGH